MFLLANDLVFAYQGQERDLRASSSPSAGLGMYASSFHRPGRAIWTIMRHIVASCHWTPSRPRHQWIRPYPVRQATFRWQYELPTVDPISLVRGFLRAGSGDGCTAAHKSWRSATRPKERIRDPCSGERYTKLPRAPTNRHCSGRCYLSIWCDAGNTRFVLRHAAHIFCIL